MAKEGKRLSVTVGGFSCSLEGYDDPVAALREVTDHLRSLANERPEFLHIGTTEPPRSRNEIPEIASSEEASVEEDSSNNAPPLTFSRNMGEMRQAQSSEPVQPSSRSPLEPAAVSSGGPATPEAEEPRPRTRPLVQVIRGMGREVPTADKGGEASQPSAATTDKKAQELPADVHRLRKEDRVDIEARSARALALIKKAPPPDAKSFIEDFKAESNEELFEAASAYLIHIQGYRHVTPRQVMRVLQRGEMVHAPIANAQELVGAMMKEGTLGGNLQEGLTMGPSSAFSKENLELARISKANQQASG